MTAILLLGLYVVDFLDELFYFPEKGVPFLCCYEFLPGYFHVASSWIFGIKDLGKYSHYECKK